MAPGDAETRTQYYGDDRVVWVVWGGQIRFTIDGQAPFVASKKGFMVEVPQRVRYSMETVEAAPPLAALKSPMPASIRVIPPIMARPNRPMPRYGTPYIQYDQHPDPAGEI